MAGLAAFFQEVAQVNSPSRHDVDNGSEASMAAQSLAALQWEVMQLLVGICWQSNTAVQFTSSRVRACSASARACMCRHSVPSVLFAVLSPNGHSFLQQKIHVFAQRKTQWGHWGH